MMAEIAPQDNNSEKELVEQIKRAIKCDFSTDEEGILQFNKNGYQAKINDILKTVDKSYDRFKNRGFKR